MSSTSLTQNVYFDPKLPRHLIVLLFFFSFLFPLALFLFFARVQAKTKGKRGRAPVIRWRDASNRVAHTREVTGIAEYDVDKQDTGDKILAHRREKDGQRDLVVNTVWLTSQNTFLAVEEHIPGIAQSRREARGQRTCRHLRRRWRYGLTHDVGGDDSSSGKSSPSCRHSSSSSATTESSGLLHELFHAPPPLCLCWPVLTHVC